MKNLLKRTLITFGAFSVIVSCGIMDGPSLMGVSRDEPTPSDSCINAGLAKGLKKGKFGSPQVFDSSRSPAFPEPGIPFEVSSFDDPIDSSGNNYTLAAGEYLTLFMAGGDLTVNTGVNNEVGCNVGLRLNRADGSSKEIFDSGTVWGIGEEGFLHVSYVGDYGTFFSVKGALGHGDGVSYTPKRSIASCEDLENYVVRSDVMQSGEALCPNPVMTYARVTSLSRNPTASATETVTMQWSELIDHSTFTESDLTVGGGTIASGSLSCVDTPLVTPTHTECEVTLNLVANGLTTLDLAANKIRATGGSPNSAIEQFRMFRVPGVAPATNGGSLCQAMAVDINKNSYCVGMASSALASPWFNGMNILAIKFDKAGDIVWARQIGSSGFMKEKLNSLTAANGGGTTAGGNLFYCRSIAVDDDQNVYCAGDTNISFAESLGGGRDAFIIKLDKGGELVWARQFGAATRYSHTQLSNHSLANGGGDTSGDDYISNIAVDGNGNVYGVGYTTGSFAETNGGGNDAIFFKLDVGGNLVWAKQYGGVGKTARNELSAIANGNGGGATGGNDSFVGIKIFNGHAFVAGSSNGAFAEQGGGSHDVILLKYTLNGEIVWARQVGSTTRPTGAALLAFAGGNDGGLTNGADSATGLDLDSSGNIYVGGTTYGSFAEDHAGSADIIMIKFDKDGTLVWARQFGDTGFSKNELTTLTSANGGGDTSDMDKINNVVVDRDGNIVSTGYSAAGFSEHSLGASSSLVIKMNANGNLIWSRQFGDASSPTRIALHGLTNALNGGGHPPVQETFTACAVDYNGDIYGGGSARGSWAEQSASPGETLSAFKMSSSGSLIWARQPGVAGKYTNGQLPLH